MSQPFRPSRHAFGQRNQPTNSQSRLAPNQPSRSDRQNQAKPKPKPQSQPKAQNTNRRPVQRPQKKAIPQRRAKPKPLQTVAITAVQIEGLVLLKIIKHCGEYSLQRQAVSGKLLGLPTNQKGVVEITNCFPIPTSQFTESDDSFENDKKSKKAHKKADKYAQDMIRLMTRIREDNFIVGFYRSALDGAFLTAQTIDACYRHQSQSQSSVCIIYDPTASVKGRLVVRAFRLTQSFMKFYETREFGPSKIANADLTAQDIFKELSVKIHNSHLVHAFLYEIAQLNRNKKLTNGFQRLHHSHDNALMTSLKQLSGAIDGYADQTQQFRTYYSKSKKNKDKKEEAISRAKQDNQQRKIQGQKVRPMPDFDKLFPSEPEPNRIESVTLTAQMNEYTDEVENSIMQGLVKLWVTQGIHSENVIQ